MRWHEQQLAYVEQEIVPHLQTAFKHMPLQAHFGIDRYRRELYLLEQRFAVVCPNNTTHGSVMQTIVHLEPDCVTRPCEGKFEPVGTKHWLATLLNVLGIMMTTTQLTYPQTWSQPSFSIALVTGQSPQGSPVLFFPCRPQSEGRKGPWERPGLLQLHSWTPE